MRIRSNGLKLVNITNHIFKVKRLNFNVVPLIF